MFVWQLAGTCQQSHGDKALRTRRLPESALADGGLRAAEPRQGQANAVPSKPHRDKLPVCPSPHHHRELPLLCSSVGQKRRLPWGQHRGNASCLCFEPAAPLQEVKGNIQREGPLLSDENSQGRSSAMASQAPEKVEGVCLHNGDLAGAGRAPCRSSVSSELCLRALQPNASPVWETSCPSPPRPQGQHLRWHLQLGSGVAKNNLPSCHHPSRGCRGEPRPAQRQTLPQPGAGTPVPHLAQKAPPPSAAFASQQITRRVQAGTALQGSACPGWGNQTGFNER